MKSFFYIFIISSLITVLLVRCQPSGTPDKIKVEVMSDKLWSASHEIHTIPVDVVEYAAFKKEVRKFASMQVRNFANLYIADLLT